MNSIEKTLEILNYLSNSKKSVRIADLCKDLNLQKSTVHRIFKTLKKYSLVSQEEDTSKYGLGFKVLEYANSFNEAFNFKKTINSILREICLKTDLTSYLSIWYNNQIICIDVVRPSHIINTHFSVEIGKEMPFHCTSSSKIIVAYQDPEKIKNIITNQTLKRYTPYTIINPEQLMEHLNEIKKKKIAFCNEELEQGVQGIAVPLSNYKNKVIGSIAVVGLSNRISDSIDSLSSVLVNASKELSKILGYNENIL